MKKALKLSYFLLVLVLMVSVLPVTAHADPPDDQCPDYYADLNNGGHHEWVLIHEDPATCTKDGAKYWSCEYCGRDHTDYTPALGHSWSAWTANGAGSEMRTCSRCGDTETRSVAVTTTDPPETPAPDSKVKVTKSPTGESVAAGEDAWFVAHADNSTGTNWYVQSADGGTVYSAADAPSHFPGLSVSGERVDSLCFIQRKRRSRIYRSRKDHRYTCHTLARDGGSRDTGPGTSNSCSDRRSRSDPGACSDSDRRTRALPFTDSRA